MARWTVGTGIDNYIKNLEELTYGTDEMIKRAVYEGAKIVTDAIRNLIRAGNTPQIANAVATSAAIGGQTMDQALVRLVRGGQITRDMAMKYAHEPEYVKKNAI